MQVRMQYLSSVSAMTYPSLCGAILAGTQSCKSSNCLDIIKKTFIDCVCDHGLAELTKTQSFEDTQVSGLGMLFSNMLDEIRFVFRWS